MVALAIALATALTGGPAASAAANGLGVTQSPGAIRAYWTPERMRHALPGALLAPGGGPATAASTSAKRGSLHDAVVNPKRRGVRTAGKVFFSQGLFDYECSGTVVRAPSRSLVLSAGHCAYADGVGGGYGKNWIFVPAYRSGRAPFGRWTTRPGGLVAPSEWVDSALTGGDSRYDVSAATLAPLRGERLQDVVGARTPRFNAARGEDYDAIGYPAEDPFDGQDEFRCRSPLTASDPRAGSPATLGIACDMTGGSSGGGWIVARKYIESVTSYGYNNDPYTLYGPYFGSAIKAFYNSVKYG